MTFGRVTLRFRKVADTAEGSVGSAIDHLGFAYPDIVAKMRELAANDVEIISAIETEGPIKYAFVRDRWNTLLEIVEDAEITGFHHVHIATTNTRGTLDWYQHSLSGERSRFAGVLPGVLLSRRMGAGQGSRTAAGFEQGAVDRSCRLVRHKRR